MPWAVAAAAVAAGGAIYSANKQSQAAKDAANASQNATDQSIAEQRREFDINQQNLAPWLNTGKSALSVLAGMYGLNGDGSGTSANAPDYSAFYESPDYQFAMQQGQQALDRSAAARGSLFSGGHNADTVRFGQGLASQQFGNFYNRLAGLAGIGQSTATNLGQQGMGMASNIGNLLTNNAANQTNSIYNKANAYTNLAGQVGGIAGQLAGYYGNRPQTAGQTAYQYPSTGVMYGGTYNGPNSMNTGDWSNIDVGGLT